MNQFRLVLIAMAGSAVGGFLLGGGLTGSRVAATPAAVEQPDAEAHPTVTDPDLVPVMAELGPLFAPIWTRSRISGFVAAEFMVEFAPGTIASPILPSIQDRILAVLYRAGAEGRLDPGRTDPEGLRAELITAVRAAAPAALRDLRIGKLVHQENRR